MKTKCRNLLLLIIICMGCTESDNTFQGEDNRSEFFKPVDPKTEVNRFSRELNINGQNIEGEMPIATNMDNTFVNGFTSSASITSDNFLFLPVTFTDENDVVEALVHIKNADNYWQIPVTPINNSTNLQIGIPSHVLNGTFIVDYVLKKSDGATSQILETQVGIVSPESECSGFSFPTISGSDGLTVKTYTLPDIGAGNLTITYNTFTIPDRVDVRYNDQWVESTGDLLSEGEAPPVKECRSVSTGDGFIGTANSFDLAFDTNISNKLDIYVSGCLNNGTQWTVTVSCPQNDVTSALWYEKLPDCPCSLSEIPENNQTPGFNGEWIICNEASQIYHLGARSEIRWIPNQVGNSGQQCTYDATGNLITSGIAAGSPDLVSPGSCGSNDFINQLAADNLCEFSAHCLSDVKPWQKNNNETLPCTSYLKLWPANQGECGNSNPVNDINHLTNIIGNMSCEEVTTLFQIGSSAENADFSIVPAELILYLSGQNKNTPANLLEMLNAVANQLNCGNNDNEQCKVLEKAIKNLTS